MTETLSGMKPPHRAADLLQPVEIVSSASLPESPPRLKGCRVLCRFCLICSTCFTMTGQSLNLCHGCRLILAGKFVQVKPWPKL